MTENQQKVEEAKATIKGYEDGLALCKQAPLADFTYFIGCLAVKMTQANIEIELDEYYRIGFVAAWDETHQFNVADEFTKDMYGASSMEQAIMRDLEQS